MLHQYLFVYSFSLCLLSLRAFSVSFVLEKCVLISLLIFLIFDSIEFLIVFTLHYHFQDLSFT
jgi:hypothetical protein